jgi:NAD(P)-dependent dehydrogenase (short-subunit alcohol dehydrogenase family)
MSSNPKRVALVTGCGKASGIGAAIARRLAAQGIAVVVSDVQAQGVLEHGEEAPSDWHGLATLVAEIEAAGGTASSVEGDVTSERDANALVEATLARHGRVDILVNNAAAPHGGDRADIADVPVDAWDHVMAVNVRGVFLMSRAVVTPMRRERWGRIVNISSAVIRYGARHRTAYTASKAAVVGFTRALAMDVADAGITVNAVCPGSVLTARATNTTRKLGWNDVEAGLAERARRIPLGRHGSVEEVAALVAYLASDDAGYVTAQEFYVDGGGLPVPQFSASSRI